MKKAVLGLGILGIYGIYSLGIRHQQPTINKPSSLSTSGKSSNSSSVATNTSSSSNSSSANSNTGSSGSGSTSTGKFKDGTYVGSAANAYYGNVQVKVTISGGKITDVTFLQYPNSHSTSVYINQQVMPYLKQEAIQAQSSNVQYISGATFTSQAFAQSLGDALSKAG